MPGRDIPLETLYHQWKQGSPQFEQVLASPEGAAKALLKISDAINKDVADAHTAHALILLAGLLAEGKINVGSFLDMELVHRVMTLVCVERISSVVCASLSVLSFLMLGQLRTYETHSLASSQKRLADLFPEALATFPHNLLAGLVSKLAFKSTQVVVAALQTLNVFVHKLVFVGGDLSLYCQLRLTDFGKNISSILDSRSHTNAAMPHLRTLQDLLKAITHKFYGALPSPDSDKFVNELIGLSRPGVTEMVGVDAEGTPQYAKACVSSLTDCYLQFGGATPEPSPKIPAYLDFMEFINSHDITFTKLFVEHSTFSKPTSRFPLARASRTVSQLILDFFGFSDSVWAILGVDTPESFYPPNRGDVEINDSDFHLQTEQLKLTPSLSTMDTHETTSSSASIDISNSLRANNMNPYLFDAMDIHNSAMAFFLKCWRDSKAQLVDYERIASLVALLFQTAKTDMKNSSLGDLLQYLDDATYTAMRQKEIILIEDVFVANLKDEFAPMHERFQKEAMTFVREQRLMCLSAGEWFPVINPLVTAASSPSAAAGQQHMGKEDGERKVEHFFVILAMGRKVLRWGVYDDKQARKPTWEEAPNAIELASVTRVEMTHVRTESASHDVIGLQTRTKHHKVSIYGQSPTPMLAFFVDTEDKAAEWVDGINTLIGKPMSTEKTKQYVTLFTEMSLRAQVMGIGPEDNVECSRVGTLPMWAETSDAFYYV